MLIGLGDGSRRRRMTYPLVLVKKQLNSYFADVLVNGNGQCVQISEEIFISAKCRCFLWRKRHPSACILVAVWDVHVKNSCGFRLRRGSCRRLHFRATERVLNSRFLSMCWTGKPRASERNNWLHEFVLQNVIWVFRVIELRSSCLRILSLQL